MQDISGWRLDEFSNVPNADGTTRHTFQQTLIAAQASLLLCNDRADAYLLSVCDVETSIGMNGNDALVLVDEQGNRVVCSSQ